MSTILTPALSTGPLESLGFADDARLQAAYDRLAFQHQALEHEQQQIAAHNSHCEYDPAWIAAGEEMDALWLALGTLHDQLLRRRAEWTAPPWEPGDPDPF